MDGGKTDGGRDRKGGKKMLQINECKVMEGREGRKKMHGEGKK